ncbi:MAG: SGNH/GDSL hydrolase family protein [Pseudomonadota bacterium]
MQNRLRHFILFPAYLVQAGLAYALIPRMCEPDGARHVTVGQGPHLRLLVLGDSSAAGVGTVIQDKGLFGQLVQNLADTWTIQATLCAQSGATAETVLELMKELEGQDFDIAVISMGLNDAKNGVKRPVWLQNYGVILDQLQSRHGTKRIIVSGLAPIREFPAMRAPLRHYLGDLRDWFDKALENMVRDRDGIEFLPIGLKMDHSKMAQDGFHPGPEVYAAWARRIALHVKQGHPENPNPPDPRSTFK